MKRHRAAFTLFEVLISIAIFLLLAGGIFATVRAAFSASAEIATSQLDAERSEALQRLLRRFFLSLPADASVELRLRQEAGRGDVVELLAWPVPEFLRFGDNTGDGIALTGRPDGRGGFRFSIGYFRAEDPPETRDRRLEAGQWLTLLSDVRDIRWRLAPARNPVFSETWNAASGRPGVAELTLGMANGDRGVFTYWIPPLQRRSNAGAGDEPAPAPPPLRGGQTPPPAPGAAQTGESVP